MVLLLNMLVMHTRQKVMIDLFWYHCQEETWAQDWLVAHVTSPLRQIQGQPVAL